MTIILITIFSISAAVLLIALKNNRKTLDRKALEAKRMKQDGYRRPKK
jgi:hypothetical protein